ncbi:hypothetical protein ACFVT8_12150 [Lysinibacillus sp. NPDC058147]|uniref:hypothetical protein n=1 Tax=unclassified Lysinibacillus TaxID=2636778 RepID=UPI0036DE3328
MKFIEPKYSKVEFSEYRLSERTRKLIKHYAVYTGLTESQVLEEFLQNLLEDEGFIEHINSLRNNIRIKKEFGIADE